MNEQQQGDRKFLWRTFVTSSIAALFAVLAWGGQTLVAMRDDIRDIKQQMGFEAQARGQRDAELTEQINRLWSWVVGMRDRDGKDGKR